MSTPDVIPLAGQDDLPDLPLEQPGYAAPDAIAAARQAMAGAVSAGHWRTDPSPVEQWLDGVKVLRFRPSGVPRGTILHFHGGGYRMGCPEMVGPYAAALAERCSVEVICPAYRLAPENPFPAGVKDGLAVLKALEREGSCPIILSGDSAGGGLAASLAILAVKNGTMLAGLVLLSAWLDLSVSAPGYTTNAGSDPLFSSASAGLAAELYLQGHTPPSHPLASPLFANLAGLPPTLLSVGEGEVLVDDARTMNNRLHSAGVPVTFVPVAGMDHTAVVRGLSLPGAAETFEHVTTFIEAVLETVRA